MHTRCMQRGNKPGVVRSTHASHWAISRYQQAPDTFHRALVVPENPVVLKRLAGPDPRGFKLDLRQSRTAGHGTDSGRVK